MRKYNVIAAGHAYTDIVASVKESFLVQNGIPIDGGYAVDNATIGNLSAQLTNTKMLPGGPGANTVSTVSALGGRTGFFGKVNHDHIGEFFLDDLRSRNVDLCCNPYNQTVGASATCLVLLTENKQRSFAYSPACADRFHAEDFYNFDFGSTDFFLIEACLLTSPHSIKAIAEALELSKNKCRVVVNLQMMFSWKYFERIADFILSHADIIIGNEAEQAAFQAAVTLPHSPSQIIVTTKAERGVDAKMGGTHTTMPAPEVPHIVSTLGAGDAFTGGFLLALSKNLSLSDSLRCGTKVAASILQGIGARPQKLNPKLYLGQVP